MRASAIFLAISVTYGSLHTFLTRVLSNNIVLSRPLYLCQSLQVSTRYTHVCLGKILMYIVLTHRLKRVRISTLHTY